MQINPFKIVGGPTVKGVPLIQQKPPKSDALARALLASAYSSEPRTPFEAIGKLAQVWSGTRLQDKYLEGEEAKEREPYDKLREAISGGGDVEEALLASEDPSLFMLGLKTRLQPAPETWSPLSPDERAQYGIAPDDQSLYMRNSSTGEVKIPGGRGTTVHNNLPPQQSSFEDETGKLGAKKYGELQDQAMAADQMLGLFDLAEIGLNSGVRTGFLGAEELSVRRFAEAIGAVEPDAQVAGGELLTAVTNKMALMMRSPDSGMGMPGAVSNRDLTFLKEAQVGIDRSPQGNRLMLEVFRRMEQRKKDIAQLASMYVNEYKTLDSGFYLMLSRWAEQNPMFDDLQSSGSGGQDFNWIEAPTDMGNGITIEEIQ